MINFKKIKLRNYLSFKDASIDFTKGMSLVLGINYDDNSTESNGSGKTSLFEAVTWCLFKKSVKGNNVSHNGQGNCMVELDFSKGDEEYRVIRYYGDKNYGNFLCLFLDDNEITTHTASSTQELLNNILGINYEHFISTVIVTEGLPISLTHMTPTPRKEYIEQVTGFNQIWNSYLKEIKRIKSEVDLSYTDIYNEYTTERDSYLQLSGKCDYMKKLSDEKDSMLEIIETKLTKGIEKIKSYEIKESKIPFDKDEYDYYDNLLTKLDRNISLIKRDLSGYKSLLKNQVCPTCSQKFPKERISEAEEKIITSEEKISKYSKKYSDAEKIVDKYENLEKEIKDINKEISEFKEEVSNLKTKKSTIKNSGDDLNHIEEELSHLQEKIDNLEGECNAFLAEKEKLSILADILSVSGMFRSLALEKYINIYNDFLEEISIQIYPEISVKFFFDSKFKGLEFHILHKNNGKIETYLQLSRGRRKRVDIIAQLAFYKLLEIFSSVSFNLVVLDEIFDGIDNIGVEAIIQAISQLWSDRNIYIITHDDKLKSFFTNTITVHYQEGESYLIK